MVFDGLGYFVVVVLRWGYLVVYSYVFRLGGYVMSRIGGFLVFLVKFGVK